MPSTEPRPPLGTVLPPLRLTQRGRVVLAVGALLLVVLLASLIKGCGADATTTGVPASTSPAAAGSPSASPTPSVSSSAVAPSATASRTSILDGIVNSGDKGSGAWNQAKVAIATMHTGKTTAHRYVVKVETNLGLDQDAVARQVQSILDDDRSWSSSTSNSFALVTDPAKADLTIYLASPDTTQKMCRPLDVLETWSCRQGSNVILNADRWRYMTPTYDDLSLYRAYMVNHEVGHFIGRDHVGCPAQGFTAPVMMQQSKSLGGCTINPWPSASDGR